MRSAPIVVDAWAALALLRGEGNAAVAMRRYLRRAHGGRGRLVMSLVNLAEVFYRMIQVSSEERAEETLAVFRRLPIDMLPVREPVAQEAARLKAAHPLSLADAFAVATARLEGGRILTGDKEIVALPRAVVSVIALER